MFEPRRVFPSNMTRLPIIFYVLNVYEYQCDFMRAKVRNGISSATSKTLHHLLRCIPS